MRNLTEKNSCLFGEELVSYIYGELLPAGRRSFESHLVECSGCAAELADISMSRLGIYEWHRDEFASLATPNFTITYEMPQPEVSWLEALRGLVPSPMRLSLAGASLAVVVIGFVLAANYRTTEETVANTSDPVPTAPLRVPAAVSDSEVAKPDSVTPKNPETVTVREFRNDRQMRPSRAVPARSTISKKRPLTDKANTASAPRLGNFVETEDTSLRLADLVADIDTKD